MGHIRFSQARDPGWKPGQPCAWNKDVLVVAPYRGVGGSLFRVGKYSGDLDVAIRAAAQWSRAGLAQHPGAFTSKEQGDADTEITKALSDLEYAEAVENHYDQYLSEFGIEIDVPRRRPRVGCPHELTPAYPDGPYDGVTRWRLWDSAPMGVSFSPPYLRGWTSRCFYPPSPNDTGTSGTTVRLYSRGRPTNAPRVSGVVFNRGAWISEGPASNTSIHTERLGLRNSYREHVRAAADRVRCVQLGVAFKISYALNRRKYQEQTLAAEPRPSTPTFTGVRPTRVLPWIR